MWDEHHGAVTGSCVTVSTEHKSSDDCYVGEHCPQHTGAPLDEGSAPWGWLMLPLILTPRGSSWLGHNPASQEQSPISPIDIRPARGTIGVDFQNQPEQLGFRPYLRQQQNESRNFFSVFTGAIFFQSSKSFYAESM